MISAQHSTMSQRSGSVPFEIAPGADTGAHRLRDAAPGDGAAIARIYNESILAADATMDTEPVDASYYEEKLADPHPRECWMVAVDGDEVLGWGCVKRYSDRPGYAIACETSIYVARSAQGAGVGKQLLPRLVERAGTFGYRHLVAKIVAANQRSVDFHLDHGFEWVGKQRNIGVLQGVLQDVVILQRLLPEAD